LLLLPLTVATLTGVRWNLKCCCDLHIFYNQGGWTLHVFTGHLYLFQRVRLGDLSTQNRGWKVSQGQCTSSRTQTQIPALTLKTCHQQSNHSLPLEEKAGSCSAPWCVGQTKSTEQVLLHTFRKQAHRMFRHSVFNSSTLEGHTATISAQQKLPVEGLHKC
jgi:hypothetical protein